MDSAIVAACALFILKGKPVYAVKVKLTVFVRSIQGPILIEISLSQALFLARALLAAVVVAVSATLLCARCRCHFTSLHFTSLDCLLHSRAAFLLLHRCAADTAVAAGSDPRRQRRRRRSCLTTLAVQCSAVQCSALFDRSLPHCTWRAELSERDGRPQRRVEQTR